MHSFEDVKSAQKTDITRTCCCQTFHKLSSHLEQDFDEDTRGRGSVILGEAHRVNDLPGDGVGGKQVAEEARDIAQLVGLQSVDQRVLAAETLLKARLILALQQAEALRQQPVVPAAANWCT